MAAEGFGDLGTAAEDDLANLALDSYLDEFLREQNLGPGDIEEFKLSEIFDELVKELSTNPIPSSITRTIGNNSATPAAVTQDNISSPQPSTSKQAMEEGLKKRRNSTSSGYHHSSGPTPAHTEGSSPRSRPPKKEKTSARTQLVNSRMEQTASSKLDNKECKVKLVDLSEMKSLFPAEVPTQIMTSLKMIQKIADLEEELKRTLPSKQRKNKEPDMRLERKHEPLKQNYIPNESKKSKSKSKSTLVVTSTSTPVNAKAVRKEVSECETQSHSHKMKLKQRFQDDPTAKSNSSGRLAEKPESSKNLASNDTEPEDFISATNEDAPVAKGTRFSYEVQENVADTDTDNDNLAKVKATNVPEQYKDKIEEMTSEIINDAIITEPLPETEYAQKSDLEPSLEADELTPTQELSFLSKDTAAVSKAVEDDDEAQECAESANDTLTNAMEPPPARDIVNETGAGDKVPSNDKEGNTREPPEPDTDTGRNELDASKDDKSEIDEQDKEMLSVPQDLDDAGDFNPFDDDNYDSQMSSSPDVPKSTRFRRSPSPIKSSKKKKIIESSSDAETTPERKRSSDEEQMRAPLERKRDRGDSQPRKFAKLEDERRRKLSEKKNKKDKDKRKGSDTFDEVYKEKALAGSFRIPKRTTQKRTKVVSGTPLAMEQVPKENLQFERCRKSADDKDMDFDRDNFQRRNNRGGGRMGKDSGTQKGFAEGYRPKWLTANDENRMVLLAPDPEMKLTEENDNEPAPPHANIPFDDDHENEPPVMESAPVLPQPEPFWDSDGEESGGGGGATPSEPSEKDEFQVTEMDDRNVISKPDNRNQPTKPVQVPDEADDSIVEKDEELDQELDPEVPVEELVPNPFTKWVIIEMMNKEKEKKPCELPDLDLKNYNIAEGIVLKMAWWFNKCDFGPRERFHRYYDSDTELSDSEADENRDFGDDNLLPVSDDEEEFGSVRRVRVSTDEFVDAGRALLTAKYRTGPGDTFENIFHIRGGPEWIKKQNYQAYCTLCRSLVVGNSALAAHVQTEKHRRKMENLGDIDPKSSEDEGKAKAEAVKLARSKDKKKENVATASVEKEKEPQKIGDKRQSEDKKKGESLSGKEKKDKERESESDDKDREEHNRKRIADDRERRKERERERSRHRSRDRSPSKKSKEEGDAEIGVTSTGLSLKIPSSAMPNRKRRSRSKSRSRSPRRDRKRVRSPLRVRRSRSPRERGHSRTPVERIARSPARHRELKDQRRSSSVERRMDKFVAENSRRRSPSASRSRKRARRSRSRSPSNNPLNRKRDNREFNQKLTLTAMGLWTDDLEQKWKLVELEEAMFIEQFLEKKKALNDRPENYPTYADEWAKFWERRSLELEKEGINSDDYNYLPEWKKFWQTTMNDLLEAELQEKLAEIRMKHGMDINSLLKIGKDNLNNEPTVKATPVPAPVPAPVPPPSAEPTFLLKSVAPPALSTGSFTDDVGAKPMSISSEGGGSNNSHVEMPPQVQTTNTPAVPPVTVTPNDFLTQWKNMTSVPSSSTTRTSTNGNQLLNSSSLAKTVDAKSVTSSSIASIDLAGFDLVEVLRLLSTMEDQLSFLAPQTKEYFKRAEECELKKHNKSLELMEEKDFVILVTQIRDRFIPLSRSPLQSVEALRRLQTSLESINVILETPQCKKHKIASPTQISPRQESEPEIEIINVVEEPRKGKEPSPSTQRPMQQPHPDSSESTGRLSQSQKTKISWMLSNYLTTYGYQYLTDAELRRLVKTILGQRDRSGSRASQGSTPTNSGAETSTARRFVSPDSSTPCQNPQLQRSASAIPTSFARPRNPSVEPWPSPSPSNTPQISKTYNIVTTKAMGSAFPSLPDFSPPPNSVLTRGREDRTRRDHVGFNFGSGDVSSSDSGRLSPFTRRGDNSSNPFRDKAVEITESERNLISERPVSISVIDDVYVKGQKGGKIHREEIKLGQLVTTGTSGGRRSSRDSARSDKKSQRQNENTETEGVNDAERDRLQNLPPGIRQMILKERALKSPKITPIIVIPSSDEDEDNRPRWRRRRHKRNKKRSKQEADYDSSNSDISANYEHHYRKTEREKRRRRRRRDENRRRTPTPMMSNGSEVEIDWRGMPESPSTRDRKEQIFREANYYERIGSPLSSASSRVNIAVGNVGYSCLSPAPPFREELSEISSFGDGVTDRGKRDQEQAVASVQSEVRRIAPPVVDNKVKVDFVSKTFWTMKDNDDKSLCSVSSAELRPAPAVVPVVPAVEAVSVKKISRQYRASIEIEKEDGEIESSEDEYNKA